MQKTNKKYLREFMKSKVNILVISTDHYLKDKYEEYRHGAKYENFIQNISQINPVRNEFNRTDNFYTERVEYQ